MSGSGNIIHRVTLIAKTRQAFENALLDARQVLENNAKELSEAQDRVIKFRFHNKPVESYVSNISPELIKKVMDAAELVGRLETSLQKLRSVPVNDNTP